MKSPTPAWRHKIRTTWTTPWSDYLVSADWRYYGGVKLDTGDTRLLHSKIGAQNYLDLSASVKVFGAATLHACINNVSDRGPPLIGAGQLPGIYGNGKTISQAYDAKGRSLFVGITAAGQRAIGATRPWRTVNTPQVLVLGLPQESDESAMHDQ